MNRRAAIVASTLVALVLIGTVALPRFRRANNGRARRRRCVHPYIGAQAGNAERGHRRLIAAARGTREGVTEGEAVARE